ncbi:MAG: hypothetical protein NC092_09365 [Butyrivibrio sp.]|nr:hypothetical protein [Muribaculum sp.]MCM1552884.1 hypothetical protein [Butyrivibrio sp.]
MDKYEYKVRSEEITELIEMENYAQAAEIADSIDWRKVKSVRMLCMISDLYKINKRYEDARDLLLLAYERRPGSRSICYSLCELSIKTKELVQAMEYYKEFVQVSTPDDAGRYILRYKLYKDQEVTLEERIEVLEELKKVSYQEKWVYELAYLYHCIGDATHCVAECDEMIVFFGEGEYVVKAMELKMQHQPLSIEQQEKYNHRNDVKPEETMQEDFIPEEQNDGSEILVGEAEQVDIGAFVGGETQIFAPVRTGEEAVEPAPVEQPEELDIQVKTMDVGEYNTINLQAELAQGLQELLGAEQRKEPMLENGLSADELGMAEISVESEAVESVSAESEAEELYMAEEAAGLESDGGEAAQTWEAAELVSGESVQAETAAKYVSGEPVQAVTAAEYVSGESIQAETAAEYVSGELAQTETASESEVIENTEVFFGETGEIVMEQMRKEADQRNAALQSFMEAEPPKEMANVLSQESDGQISLVMPERPKVEKQITGQMNIEEVLAEWERMKKENEEKRKEEVRKHVLRQTGKMFTEFEASLRDGLLEQLEKSVSDPADVLTDEDEVEELEDIVQEDAQETAMDETETATDVPETGTRTVETARVSLAADVKEAESLETAEMLSDKTEAAGSEAAITDSETEATGTGTEAIQAVSSTAASEATTEDMEEAEAEEAESEAAATSGTETVAENVGKSETESIQAETAEKGSIKAEEAQTDASTAESPESKSKGAKVRPMTREEKELYANYIQSRGAKEQIVKAVDGISLAAYTGNVIITGEAGMDTITLAKNIIREVQLTDSNFSGKVAKISGKGLGRKNVADTLNQLQNGALIIEDACDMNDATVQDLYKALQRESLGIVVVLQDETKVMNRFLKSHEILADAFTARVDVEALSNDMLVSYGRQYARELEFSIDELGVLALHNRIEQRQTIDHAVTTAEVKEIVDGAIYRANRKTPRHFFDILLAKRYDEEDMIVVTEKDFA